MDRRGFLSGLLALAAAAAGAKSVLAKAPVEPASRVPYPNMGIFIPDGEKCWVRVGGKDYFYYKVEHDAAVDHLKIIEDSQFVLKYRNPPGNRGSLNTHKS